MNTEPKVKIRLNFFVKNVTWHIGKPPPPCVIWWQYTYSPSHHPIVPHSIWMTPYTLRIFVRVSQDGRSKVVNWATTALLERCYKMFRRMEGPQVYQAPLPCALVQTSRLLKVVCDRYWGPCPTWVTLQFFL